MKVIEINDLSKKYIISSRSHYLCSRQKGFARSVQGFFTKKFRQKEFWALRGINISINEGEIVGIIGRNGAGKTTLLKILSRITSPTSGEAIIRGRVSSLLEVGTGFHPELTGRENIYLNGAVLGMLKKEINTKFDEIVEFAGVQQFLDTPIKRYSSGMYMRLAFAVAAHLEPEILLVDEVLSVGDYEFQKKCLQKMEDIGQQGRTIFYVSHNMASIVNLCSRVILLDKGEIVMDGETKKVVDFYMRPNNVDGSEILWEDVNSAPGDERMGLRSVRVYSEGGQPGLDVDIAKDIIIELGYWVFEDGMRIRPSLQLINSQGVVVLASFNGSSVSLQPDIWYEKIASRGFFCSTCRIPSNFLNDGSYFVNIFLAETKSGTFITHVAEEKIISFNVIDTGAMRKEFSGPWVGVVRPRLDWNTEYKGPIS